MKNFNGMSAQLAVGRIPYYGILSDLEKILLKIRNYETATDISWRKRCLLPMEPLFKTNDSYGLGEQIKNNILSPNGWKCNRLYDNENFFTGKQISAVVNMFPQPEMVPCNEPNVLREWKFRWYVYRFGLVVWSTHGREGLGITGRLAEDVFYSPSASTLTDQHPAMTFQGSCWTAAPGVTDNIAYSLLLNGGVATIGATSRAVDFENMLSSYVGTYVAQGLAYSYTDYMVSQNLGAGRSLNNAKKKGNRAFPGGEAWVNMLNFNLYGDPSISLAPQTNKGPTNLFGFTLFQKGAAYLTWDDNSNDETGFGVQARQEGTSSWTQYYGTGANGTSYMVSGFTNSANYEFRVHKLPTTSESDYSNIVSVWVNTPGPEPAYPASPTNLTSTVVSTQINLSWTDNARDETRYTIKRYCTINGTILVKIIDTVSNITSYQNKGLKPNTNYTFIVYASNANGSSGMSNSTTATTKNVLPPAAPTYLSAKTASRNQINLTWQDNSSVEIGYEIERALVGGSFVRIATTVTSATSYNDLSSLDDGIKYQYRVRSYNDAANSSYSATVSATTHANIAKGKTASASSSASSYPASYGNDSNTTTRWSASSSTVPQWFKVDLGSSRTISGSEVMWQNSGVVYKYKIQTSTDNAYWTTRVDLSNNTKTDQVQTQSFSATARYVRIYITAVPSGSWASLFEFGVFGL